MAKIINFEEEINKKCISIVSYRNGIIVGDFGSKMNVCRMRFNFTLLL